jgi:ABC-2 type transport system ATP-binding protein
VLQARLYGSGKKRARERAEALVGAFGLGAFADRPARTYSGGQRRRLDLALGLVHEPAVLFLDEPTTGLDPQSRARLWDEVRRLREAGTTVFLTTHYMDEADALCDRLAIMDGGTVVAEGTPAALKRGIAGDVVGLSLLGEADGALGRARELLSAQPFVREVDAGGDDSLRLYVERGEVAVPAILRALDREGMAVEEISLSRPTLDDVFLKQTGRSLREAPEKQPEAERIPG